MLLAFNLFYKAHGVRRIQSMLTPRLLPLTQLCRDALLHSYSLDTQHPDLDVSKIVYQTAKKVYVDYPDQMSVKEGVKSRKSDQIRTLVKPFHTKYKKFRFLPKHYAVVNDQQALFVENYNYLLQLYSFSDLPLTQYYVWYDLLRTLFANIATINKTTQKNHFLFVELPELVPSFTILDMFAKKVTTAMIKVFDTPGSLFILHLFKWIQGDESIFSDLSEADCANVNIVFVNKTGLTSVLNMGYLASWIEGRQNVTQERDPSKIKVVEAQKLTLKYLISLSSISTEEETTDNTEEELSNRRQTLDADVSDEDEEHPDDMSDSSTDGAYSAIVSTTAKKDKFVNEEEVDQALKNNSSELTLNSKLKEIDEDLNVLETMMRNHLKDKGVLIDENGNLIEEEDHKDTELPLEVIQSRLLEHHPTSEVLKAMLDRNADFKMLSAADYRKLLADIERYEKSKNPYGGALDVRTASKIDPTEVLFTPENTSIPDNPNVPDKSMLSSTLLGFDSNYVSKIYKKDMMRCVSHIQRAGIIVKEHTVEKTVSALGEYENHTLELKPIDGAASTIRWRVPVIQEDGTFVANGNKYLMRKQRIDAPIRKVSPQSVALTSYYGKTFVSISEKKSSNSLEWLDKKLTEIAYSDTPHFVQQVNTADVYDNYFKAPFIYNALAHRYKTLITAEFTLNFDHEERLSLFSTDVLAAWEKNGRIVCGKTKEGFPICVGTDNLFYKGGVRSMGGEPMGDIVSVLRIERKNQPMDFSELKVFSKVVPVGVVLGYLIGLNNVLKFLGAKWRTVEPRKQLMLAENEYFLRFKDQTLVFVNDNPKTALLVAGFNEFDKLLKMYPLKEFNHRDVYLNMLETKGMSALYIREMELMNQLFVDPITLEILQTMGEPLTFTGLLIRATELLTNYEYPDVQDMNHQRIRGYERIPGFVYTEMVRALRQYRGKNMSGRAKVDMSPYQVQTLLMKDNTIKLAEDINPIQNTKEAEVFTYVGEGGRSKETMTKPTRAFHLNDLNITSEATVDSTDVGIVAYLSANPKFVSLRGIPQTSKKTEPSSLLSTSSLLAPGADRDDGKRINFISIQNSHTVPAIGYEQPYVRTGYEYVIGHRTSDMFCCTAKQDGKIVSVDEKGIVFEYANGEQKGVKLGRIFGRAEGSIYPHDVVSDFTKPGQKFKRGDTLAYNKGFFEKDHLDPTQLVYKTNQTVRVAFYETPQTHEDSCAISSKLSGRFQARTTKLRSFVVDFKQNLREVVKVGQELGPKDILMVIEDEITASSGAFDEKSLEVLKDLANQAPKSKYRGVVDRIEVVYHGDKQDMSPTLKALADRSDKELIQGLKASMSKEYTGQVNSDYRVAGTPLALDKAEVKIYITQTTSQGMGDKIIFGLQCKSEVAEVFSYKVMTLDGQEVDAVFSALSLYKRILNSPFIIGTTTTVIKLIQKEAIKAYRGIK